MRQRPWVAAAAAAATLLVLLAVSAQAVPDIEEQSLLFETFGYGWEERWVHSSDSKYNGRFKAVTPDGWTEPGLQVPDKNRFYGISSALKAPLDVSQAGGLVVQYELRYDKGVTCGGAYLKLVTQPAANEEGQPFEPAGLRDDTPYSIMFGPDKCGDTNKVHLILRHRNPLNGTVTEKHLKTPPTPLLGAGATNLYTLKIKPDATYQILINGEVKSKGSLLEALEPPINPPATVPDPTDVKPANWVDDPKMPDPDAVKPDTWDDRAMIEDASAKKPKGWLDDEPATVDDPNATQPEDWSEEDDGTWEAPQVPNPRCASAPGCGEWKRPQVPNPTYSGIWAAPLIDNPDYKGPWVQRRVPNPDFYEDKAPLSAASLGRIGAVAIEIWTIDEGYTFDNIVVAQDDGAAAQLLALWKERSAAERAAAEAKQKEEDDKATRLKDKAAKKAAKKGKKGGKKASANLAEVIVNAFEDEPLSVLKPYLSYPLQVLQAEPWTAYVLASAPPVWLLILVVVCSGRGRRARKAAKDAAQAKKDDITGPNDDEDEDQEEDEAERRQKEKAAKKAAKAAAAAAGGQGSSGAAAPKAAPKEEIAAAAGEIAPGDEDEGDEGDEDEGEGAAGVRRRRRQA